MFHLSAKDMEDEPVEQFFTNLLIYNLINERQQDQLKLEELTQKHANN